MSRRYPGWSPSKIDSAQQSAYAARHLQISLAWGLVMIVVFAATVFAATLGGRFLGLRLLPRLNGGHEIHSLTEVVVSTSALTGVVAASVFCQRARHLVKWLRLRRLRRSGTSSTATVFWLDSLHLEGYRGSGNKEFLVYIQWRDAATTHRRERRYKFIGSTSYRAEVFAFRMQPGTLVPIYYPPGRPDRVIIDIPYASEMADMFI